MSSPGDISATFCATLVDEWVRQGVRHAVVSPGSRSTPLAVALAARTDIQFHLFHDERVASFVALGIGLETGIPAVLLCTSGTAATHFHGAVAEADLSNVPMIVCTGDRPPELRDVGAPQTIDQTKLYGSMVRWAHDPGVPSLSFISSWRSLAAQSFTSAVGQRPGPVHLNLPFAEPLLGVPGPLPAPRATQWSSTVVGGQFDRESVKAFVSVVSGRRGIFVAGKGAPSTLSTFARAIGWPVLADARSGIRNGEDVSILAFDALLRSTKFADSHLPEVVVRVGEPPASKVTNQWLTRSGAELIQLQAYANVIDPDHSVAHHFIGDIHQIFDDAVALVESVDANWIESWRAAENVAQKVLDEWCDGNTSEPSNARAVTRALGDATRFVVSSSMPIRDVEWFGASTPGVVVHSNRGANGIDGVVSTAVGVALSASKPTVVYIGDIAAVHDANALLGLSHRSIELKVVVSNNDGGSIFSFLPQASQVDHDTFELLYGTPHGVSFEDLARAFGVPYALASSSKEIQEFLSRRGSMLIEIVSDRHANVSQHTILNDLIVSEIEKSL